MAAPPRAWPAAGRGDAADSPVLPAVAADEWALAAVAEVGRAVPAVGATTPGIWAAGWCAVAVPVPAPALAWAGAGAEAGDPSPGIAACPWAGCPPAGCPPAVVPPSLAWFPVESVATGCAAACDVAAAGVGAGCAAADAPVEAADAAGVGVGDACADCGWAEGTDGDGPSNRYRLYSFMIAMRFAP